MGKAFLLQDLGSLQDRPMGNVLSATFPRVQLLYKCLKGGGGSETSHLLKHSLNYLPLAYVLLLLFPPSASNHSAGTCLIEQLSAPCLKTHPPHYTTTPVPFAKSFSHCLNKGVSQTDSPLDPYL